MSWTGSPGASAKYVEKAVGTVSWALFGAVALVAVITFVVRRRRAKVREPESV